ncbi:hypothetical protein D0T51_09610 [Parabacteroides sp. 52]|uniref:DUF5683 domain-containing protein n=1 Tax=unclassified Parabacteroides TaxID=2649774 RepID=UPI0013D37E18|nr:MULTISPECIES: DUF5683 domain-containing protein [unclassified Parabacteroides]MDH6535391.1 hypothetical protein [Parabacteroides sp. PM5-20]NDV55981.1 hypothetical protein [Parabacteroides sp. 52]
MRNSIIIFLILWMCFPLTGKAQEEKVEVYEVADTTLISPADSTVQAILRTADADIKDIKPIDISFKPDPNKAILYALIPGMGQIYNRKYWKLPIVYGGLMGCTYAISWNNRNYKDYWDAYKDLLTEDPDKKPEEWGSWTNFVPPGEDPATKINDSNFKDGLKRRKDSFRRFRDLSIIITAGVYIISILDAYVDAQLFDFDISPDLSMRIEPTVTPKTAYSAQTYGFNCSIKF